MHDRWQNKISIEKSFIWKSSLFSWIEFVCSVSYKNNSNLHQAHARMRKTFKLRSPERKKKSFLYLPPTGLYCFVRWMFSNCNQQMKTIYKSYTFQSWYILQNAPRDILEGIVPIRAPIHVMEHSAMTHVAVPFHGVIMSMDAISPHSLQQVNTVVPSRMLFWKWMWSPFSLHKVYKYCQNNINCEILLCLV